MSVFFDNPVQPILAMPIDLAKWQRHASISDPAARWRIYLHDISLNALLPWLQEEFEQPVLPWPHAAPFDIWHTLEGLCFQIGDRKVVVILSETIAMEELEIPQEWVDLPQWQADYYLAANVNVDDQQLILWGYTTHKQLKTKSTYTSFTRIYRLNVEDMVQDFSAFWVAQQLEKPTAVPLDPLPELSSAEAENLIQRLAALPDPRLVLPFSQWAALFNHDHWRQQLYQRQQGATPVSIQDWLNQIYRRGWQPIDVLLPQARQPQLRSVTTSTAVLTCGKKIIIGNNYDDLLLMFSVDMEVNNRRNIRIQLYPASEPVLPAYVVLSLEDPQTGKLLKSITAGAKDTFIQIPPFRCPAGEQLRVAIKLETISHQEEFIS